jgi:hypothetical protein
MWLSKALGAKALLRNAYPKACLEYMNTVFSNLSGVEKEGKNRRARVIKYKLALCERVLRKKNRINFWHYTRLISKVIASSRFTNFPLINLLYQQVFSKFFCKKPFFFYFSTRAIRAIISYRIYRICL